ncbi:hypothetical protein [Geobacter grbiciae]|uniref:hypothetical protein n=1 Tax=Geobacter grbiciae TaxID=155042 RepID=UPI001C028B1D|nr:hypothetical protein [Geobacter grbiciae]MBT1074455.1 hypothetical protein [Geobacter grbiciae]
MFKGLRLIAVSLVALCTFLVYDTKNAVAIVDPITISVAAAALASSVIVGGAYVYAKRYYRENGGSRVASGTKVTPSGTIARDMTISYIALGASTVNTITRNVTATISQSAVASVVKANPSRYPKLYAASVRSDYISETSTNWASPSSVVGSTIYVSSGNYYPTAAGKAFRVTGLKQGTTYSTYNGTPSFNYAAAFESPNVLYITSITGGASPYSWKQIQYYVTQVTGTAPLVDSTVPQYSQSLANVSSPLSAPVNVYSDYYGEIDDFIKSNPNVMQYADTDDSGYADGAPPFVLPVPPTMAQLDAAQSAQDADAKSSASVAAARDAATSARTAATNARARADATGDPNDIRAAEAAEAAAAAAEANLAKVEADTATKTADAAKDKADEESIPDSSPDALKTFDWSKLSQLKGALANAWPFSLLSGVVDKLSVLVREPQAPVFDLPIYGANTLRVDLSIFDPVAAVCRWAIGLLLSVGCVWYLVEFWRGR